MPLRRALFLVIALVVFAGFTAAGLLTSRQLERALLDRTRLDLHGAGMLLADRWEATAGMRMMHAKELAESPGLAEAAATGELARAEADLTAAAAAYGEDPLLIDGVGQSVLGEMPVPTELIAATRSGTMPVAVVGGADGLHLVAIAPLWMEGEWVGAAGGVTPFGAAEAGTLAGLTRTGVSFVVTSPHGAVAATTLADSVAATVAAALTGAVPDSVMSIDVSGTEYYGLAAELQEGLRVVFARNLDHELAVLPALRRTGLLAGAGALGFALVVAALFSGWVSRPVGSLASAADRLAAGDVEAPVPTSSVSEVERMARAFDAMRSSLLRRLDELEAANTELENRQERLALLQAELVRRERAASAGQLASHLAHEIRNPIASVRNCLEVLKRRASNDPESTRFADLAIDELLRMHELAEGMLGLRRPQASEEEVCDLERVAREVAALADAGTGSPGAGRVAVVGTPASPARIAPESFKQVLLNLVLNAREAAAETPVEIVLSESRGQASIEVLDRGPGIAQEHMDRIFDPFFSTKDEVRGVGLGLFLADATIRAHRGSIAAENRRDGPGARFVIHLPSDSRALVR